MRLEIKDRVLYDDTLRIEANREIAPRFRGTVRRNIFPSDKELKQMGELGARIIDQFFLCEGVTQVSVHSPYGFTIEKAMPFSWKIMRRELRGALRYCLMEAKPTLEGSHTHDQGTKSNTAPLSQLPSPRSEET